MTRGNPALPATDRSDLMSKFMSLELELKFLLPPSQSDRLHSLLATQGSYTETTKHTLLNAYFDTADKWFRQQDMGLRTRLKNGHYEQTIKLSGQQHGALQIRPEYNVSCNSVLPQLNLFPVEIWPQGTDIVSLQQKLTEIFRTDFVRQSWLLTLPDGTKADVVYDNGHVVANGQRQAISEIEIELISGNVSALFTLATALVKQLPLRSGWLSKAARGYTLAGAAVLTLPEIQHGLNSAEIVRALQQSEACYWHQPNPQALQHAAFYLHQLATSDLLQQQLTSWIEVAERMAEQLHQDGAVFSAADYNLLLLAVAKALLPSSEE